MIENERKYQKDFLFEKLGKAISEEEVLKQYHLVQEMIESNIEPDDYIISLLSETKVHPVIKTNILLWLKEKRFKRSEEHTSELQSRGHLVCRLLLEKKNK